MTLKPINPSSRFFGFNIIEDPNMTTTVVDWSLCRSPSRAMRRVRQKKRPAPLRVVPSPDVFAFRDRLIMHPETAAKLRAAVNQQEISTLARPAVSPLG